MSLEDQGANLGEGGEHVCQAQGVSGGEYIYAKLSGVGEVFQTMREAQDNE